MSAITWGEGTRAELREKRDALTDRIKSAREEVSRLSQQIEFETKLLENIDALLGASKDESASSQPQGPGAAGFSGLSVRDAIMRFMKIRINNRPIKPAKIAQLLEEKTDLDYAAKTPLGTRVANEANRMAEAGLLSKDSQARYWLPERST